MTAANRPFGGYILHEELGRGGMAVVYRATKTGALSFRKQVAIKQVLPASMNDTEYIDSLAHEARLGGFLRHPNIVEVFEFDRVDNTYYMAMEYVRGPTLRQVMRKLWRERRPMEPAVVLQVASGAAAALQHAHAARDDEGLHLELIHRDLKPSNILLTHGGTVKLMDFGVARSAMPKKHLTTAGMVKGTPLYMSPEQVRGKPLDPRSDLFSLATVMATLMLGREVFNKPELYDVMTTIAAAKTGKLVDELRAIDKDCADIIEIGWKKSPDERFPDAHSFGLALGEALSKRAPLDLGDFLAGLGFEPAEVRDAREEVYRAETVIAPSQERAEALAESVQETRPSRKLQKKVCMLGSFAVGKTSLVARFVHSMFSEEYKTTIGVKIDKKVVPSGNDTVTMVLWDLHGDDAFQKVQGSYLKGSAGYLLVIDGTRRDTFEHAKEMRERLAEALGNVPFVVAVNKADLRDDWELTDDDIAELTGYGWVVIETSAKTGQGVDEAFTALAETMAAL